jgi:site-specific DNA recombinase
MTNISTQPAQPVRRCAIYARKSNEPGFAQFMTSLEAQKEICSAYIKSQEHRGWILFEKSYVDSAQPAGSLDRPALQELLADIEAGLLDIVVIYKLDRLSRSLLDFVRLMAVLDRNSVSFVCVTQNFDTGDSLGRLIMNILLTFAQFERELTGDRIRDKRRVMASNGFWTGSKPPFGYDYVDKRLVLNRAEAKIVRRVYQEYLEQRSISAVWRSCASRGVMSKVHVSRAGVVRGGVPIHRASVRSILCNSVYAGYVTHLGARHKGRHPPIISEKMWEEVQRLRLQTTCERDCRAPLDLLPTRVFDCFGRRMEVIRKYTVTGCKRWYSSSRTAWGLAHGVPRMRARIDELERLVVSVIATFIDERKDLRAALLERGCRDLDFATERTELASRRVSGIHSEQKAAILAALISRIEVGTDNIKIAVRLRQIVRFLNWDGLTFFEGETCAKMDREATHVISVPTAAGRLVQRLRLPVRSNPLPQLPRARSRKLIRMLKQVRQAQYLVDNRRGLPVDDLAGEMRRTTGRFMKLLQLNYLAPDIIVSILDGTQPSQLTSRELLDGTLPLDWALQRKLFGFPEQPPLQTTERY